MCGESKAAAKLKLVQTLTADSHVELGLMDTFCLAFRLCEKMILDRPLIARVDLAVDPADMSTIFSLTSGKQTPEDYPDGVEGMLQIKSFVPLDPDTAIDAGRRKIWEQARLKNHILHPGPVGKTPTGLIDFHMEGTDQIITIPLNIYDKAIELSRSVARGCLVEDPRTGKDVHVPITPSSSARLVDEFYCLG